MDLGKIEKVWEVKEAPAELPVVVPELVELEPAHSPVELEVVGGASDG